MQRHNPRPMKLRPAQLAVLALLAAGAGVHSQTAPQQMETVVVSGQGRTQQLQSVPIAIQVLGGDQLRKSGNANLGDVSPYVPGLSIDATQATQPTIALRGIGTADFGIGTDSPVGLYVDGVYTGKTGGALLNFNDVKRIEVLKGPQGTLFGRNSAGGAISIVTQEPEFKRSGSATLRLGQDGLRHGELLINEPLSDSLALRTSLVSQRSDGFLKDGLTGQHAGGENAWGLRAALRLQVSGDTQAVLSLEHEKLDQRARPAVSVLPPSAAGSAPAFPADPSKFIDPRHASLQNDVAGDAETRDFNGATLRIEHSLPWAEFTSTTSYRHFNSLNRQDNDGTANPLAYLSTSNVEGNTTWQQEFRLAGKSERANWLAGVSLMHETARQTALLDTTTTSLDTLSGNVLGAPLFSTVNMLAQAVGIDGLNLLGSDWQERMSNEGRNKAFAVYGDVIWHLSPQTNLSTGLRLTRDEKRFSWYNPARTAAVLDGQLAMLNAGGFFPTLVGAGALSQAEADALNGGLTQNALLATSGASSAPLWVSRKWNDVSPRLVIDHRYSADLMSYASITRGYQAGGFNTLQVNSAYQPEHVTNLELGLKGSVPGQNFSYSAALFQYRFDNLQTLNLVPASTPGGIPAYQVTISDQHATGLDLDARWQPLRGLKLFGSLAIIDQTYRHGSSSAGTSLAGQPVGTPRISASGGGEWQWAAAGGLASAGLQASYTSAQRCNDESEAQGQCFSNANFRVGAAKERLDARLAWDSIDQRWGLGLVVNNLLDKRSITKLWYEGAPLGAAYATLGRPRSVAFEVHASY